MAEHPCALIVGAGIAGLSVANGLTRTGWPGELSLVDPDPRPVGVAVGLSSTALRALLRLGVLDPVLQASTPSMTLHMCDADGSDLIYVERAQPLGQPYPDNVIVERTALATALKAPLREHGITVRTDSRIVDAKPTAAGVEVVFDDGRSDEYDLVIDASGIGSPLRRLVIADEPVRLEQLGLRWVMGGIEGLDHGTMFLGPRATKLGLWPLRGGRTYAFLTLPRPGQRRASRDAVLAELAEVLDGFTFPGAEQVRAEVPWEDVHIAPFQSLAPEAPWHTGRLVLIGDAAHVMPPHGSSGAAMAIEDADVLAGELRARPVDEALEAYSARRVDRVRRVVEFSTGNCLAENEAVAAGRQRAPLMDAEASRRFWEFIRQEP